MSAKGKGSYRCWRCERPLPGLGSRIGRLEQCPHCRAELHVCRMCRHYDEKVIGQCRHDHAERVEKKTVANFCTYLRPAKRPRRPGDPTPTDEARAALDALFGDAPEGKAEEGGEAPLSDAERARRELERLFGTGDGDGG